MKFDASGNAQWAQTASAAADYSQFKSLATDSAGNVYAAGYQNGSGLFTYASGVNAQGTSSGNNSIVVKFDASGKALFAKTLTAGTDASSFSAVAADASDAVYAGGSQNGIGTYGYGSGAEANGTYSSGANAVIVKYVQ